MVLLPYICQNSSNSFWNGSRLKNNNRKQTSMSNFLESRFGNPIFIPLSQALCGSVLPQRQQIEWAMNDLPPESTRMWPGSQTHLWMRSSFFLSLFFFTCPALGRTWGRNSLSTADIPCEQGKIFMLLPGAVLLSQLTPPQGELSLLKLIIASRPEMRTRKPRSLSQEAMGRNANLAKTSKLISASVLSPLKHRKFDTRMKVAHLFMLLQPNSVYKTDDMVNGTSRIKDDLNSQVFVIIQTKAMVRQICQQWLAIFNWWLGS